MKTQTIPTKENFLSKESSTLSKDASFSASSFANNIVLVATMALLIIGASFVYYLQPDFYNFNQTRINSSIGLTFIIITSALLLFKVLFFFYNVYLYFQYKSIESVTDELLPTCTIIVPAYNEGKLVYETLVSIANSDFPKDKLQILAIDDGSKDDT